MYQIIIKSCGPTSTSKFKFKTYIEGWELDMYDTGYPKRSHRIFKSNYQWGITAQEALEKIMPEYERFTSTNKEVEDK